MEFGPLKLKRCKYGWMLFWGQFIGKSFDRYGEYSESEVQLMRQFIRDGDIVIDVGADGGPLGYEIQHASTKRDFIAALILGEGRPAAVAE